MKFKYPKAALILALAAGSTTALGACGQAGGGAQRRRAKGEVAGRRARGTAIGRKFRT